MPCNPYQAPITCREAPTTGPPTRAGFAAVIKSYLAGEITAFEFDGRLEEFHGSTDNVIRFVASTIWHYYDDCNDYLVCLSKSEWDYLQRLLLLLESDCRLETTSRWMWSIRQLFAVVAFTGFIYCAAQSGFGYHLLILAIPFGVISMLLAYSRQAPPASIDPYHAIIRPFATLQDLEIAYRSSEFRKTQYPRSITERRVHSPLVEGFAQLYSHVIWSMLAPIPLFFQILPSRQTEIQARANVRPEPATQ